MYCDLEVIDGGLKCKACETVYPLRPLPFRVPCQKFPANMKAKPHVAGPIKAGAGTELKNLLAKFNVTNEADCGCGGHATMMDAYGTEWCRNNVEVIVTWLVDAAKSRGWKFAPRWGARRLVGRAIERAEKNKENA